MHPFTAGDFSDDQSKGLGENGRQGIHEFIRQHTCNRICQGLGLAHLTDLNNDFERKDNKGVPVTAQHQEGLQTVGTQSSGGQSEDEEQMTRVKTTAPQRSAPFEEQVDYDGDDG